MALSVDWGIQKMQKHDRDISVKTNEQQIEYSWLTEEFGSRDTYIELNVKNNLHIPGHQSWVKQPLQMRISLHIGGWDYPSRRLYSTSTMK